MLENVMSHLHAKLLVVVLTALVVFPIVSISQDKDPYLPGLEINIRGDAKQLQEIANSVATQLDKIVLPNNEPLEYRIYVDERGNKHDRMLPYMCNPATKRQMEAFDEDAYEEELKQGGWSQEKIKEWRNNRPNRAENRKKFGCKERGEMCKKPRDQITFAFKTAQVDALARQCTVSKETCQSIFDLFGTKLLQQRGSDKTDNGFTISQKLYGCNRGTCGSGEPIWPCC
jgi:hypothetical protein